MSDFNDIQEIDVHDIPNMDLDELPDGANYIFEDGTPVAVIMNIEYYKYLEYLMNTLKDTILNTESSKDE